jgi:hypothetical protein
MKLGKTFFTAKNAKQSNNNLCALCGEISRLPKQVRDFLIYYGEIVHRKENQPHISQRAQSVEIPLCVLYDLCGFSNQRTRKSPTNQTKPMQEELKTCN